MSLLLDAGALIALERSDPEMWRRVDTAHRAGHLPLTHGGVVAQVWRGGTGRQAQLARALRGVLTVALDDRLGRRAGVLLARSGLDDAVDAALVAMCRNGDEILTSDPGDLEVLARAARLDVNILPI